MAKLIKLTHERLLELLDFDPATGVFVWKVARSNRIKAGSRAGVVHRPSGGRYVTVDDEKFMAHRLAWFFVHRRWPNTDVRPNDGDYDNCAIENLREVSRVELAHVRAKISTNTSGYAGVSRARDGKWQSKITWNYRQISLGANFSTAEEASEAYLEAERRLKSAATADDQHKALEGLRVWKGQKTAWKFLLLTHDRHEWSSFEDFCRDVVDVPVMRYAMVPIDVSHPIGPGNFRWAFPPDATRQTPEGILAHNRVRREENRDWLRDRDFRRKYGIEFADYQRMFVEQRGVCAICEQPETKVQGGSIQMLSIDHNHTTKVVRGLLCSNCNNGIGYFKEDPERMRKAIAYVEQKNAATPDNVVRFAKPPDRSA